MTALFPARAFAWALLALAAIAVPAASARAAAPRDNVLVLLLDDIGPDALGVYRGPVPGATEAESARTPNLDALAAVGLRFDNAYANPLCSTTRATLHTGRYSFRTGVGRLVVRQKGEGLDSRELTLAEALSPAGYDSSMVGKWHLSPQIRGSDRGPIEHGFRYAAITLGNVRSYFRFSKAVHTSDRVGKPKTVEGYLTSETTDDAIARMGAMPEPWLLWVSYQAVHAPLHVPPADLHGVPDPEESDAHQFRAMLEALDHEIGRLLAAMPAEVRARTTIFALGDNGPLRSHAGTPFAKGTVKEAGVRIPFIVAGPRVPEAQRGKATPALVNTVDLFATVAEIAGVAPKATPERGPVDSRSLLPVLSDPKAQARPFVYAEKFLPNGRGVPRLLNVMMVREGRWKLVRRIEGGEQTDRLYRLGSVFEAAEPPDLCPCPEGLPPEASEAYTRLVTRLESLRATEAAPPAPSRPQPSP